MDARMATRKTMCNDTRIESRPKCRQTCKTLHESPHIRPFEIFVCAPLRKSVVSPAWPTNPVSTPCPRSQPWFINKVLKQGLHRHYIGSVRWGIRREDCNVLEERRLRRRCVQSSVCSAGIASWSFSFRQRSVMTELPTQVSLPVGER